MPALSKLCVHTATTKPLSLEATIEAYTNAGIVLAALLSMTLFGERQRRRRTDDARTNYKDACWHTAS